MRTAVLSPAEACESLPNTLSRFRAEDPLAEPMIFGSQGAYEAVVVPYGLFEDLRAAIEKFRLTNMVRQRIQSGGASEDLAVFAERNGFSVTAYEDARRLGADPSA